MARKKQYQYEEADLENQARPPSRSQKKRDSTALQELGEKLARMAPGKLKTLGLPDDLEAALVEYHTLSTHEAKRRQLQYVGRLMREAGKRGTLPPLSLP